MANFWNRGRDGVNDAQDYLRSTDHVSRPMALLLSLFGFLLVFAVVFSLFLGGRWLWNKLTEDNSNDRDTVQTVTAPSTTSSSDSTDGPSVTVVDNETDTDSSSTSDDDSTSETTTDDADADENDKSPAATSLPRTGPTENALALVAVTVIAGVVHNIYARSRS
ncbi:MAG: hypothetical protein AAF413_00015 [Patescibacteria group bacterium]